MTLMEKATNLAYSQTLKSPAGTFKNKTNRSRKSILFWLSQSKTFSEMEFSLRSWLGLGMLLFVSEFPKRMLSACNV